MCIDPFQTHAQGPLKTHPPHNSLTNEALPRSWCFMKKIIFDLFTIVQLLFSLKPIKADVRCRVQEFYEMCRSMILVLPSEVRDSVATDGQVEYLLFVLSYSYSSVGGYISELFSRLHPFHLTLLLSSVTACLYSALWSYACVVSVHVAA